MDKGNKVALCSVKECYDFKRILYQTIHFLIILLVCVLLMGQLAVALPFMTSKLLESVLKIIGVFAAVIAVLALIRLIADIRASKDSVLNLYKDAAVLYQKKAFGKEIRLNIGFDQIESIRYIRNLPGLIHKIVITYTEKEAEGKTASFCTKASDAMNFVHTYNQLVKLR